MRWLVRAILALGLVSGCAPREQVRAPTVAMPRKAPLPHVAGELPKGTLVAARLNGVVGTDAPPANGKWTATVAQPAELKGARIEGRVLRLESGKGARPPKLELAVDRLCTARRCGEVQGKIASLDLEDRYDEPSRQPARTGVAGGIFAGTAVMGPLGTLLGAAVGGASGVAASVGERPIEARLKAGSIIVVRLEADTPV